MTKAVFNLKYWLKLFLDKNSLTSVLKLHDNLRKNGFDSKKDILVEGYPRSGNSYIVRYLGHFLDPQKISHHTHLFSSCKKHLDKGSKCIILIRNPIESIASNILINPLLSRELAIKHYINFYEGVASYPSDAFLMINFDDFVNNQLSILNSINKYLELGEIDEHEYKLVDNKIRLQVKIMSKERKNFYSLPSLEKDSYKAEIKESLQGIDLIAEAVTLYTSLAYRNQRS